MMRVALQRDGATKHCKLGFSWTSLFFGWMVPFFRLDFKWGIVLLVGAMILPAIWEGYEYELAGFMFRVNLGLLLNAVMAFCYNNMYVADLLQAGFLPVGDEDEKALFDYELLVEEDEEDGES